MIKQQNNRFFFFFSSRRRHTRLTCDWSSDVCSSDLFGYIWREVLDHSTQSVNLKRFTSGAANVLEEHRGAPVGVIESARLDDDKVLRAIIRFSRSDRAQEVQQDI